MKTYEINGIKYSLEKNYRDGFDQETTTERLTDYFYDYDYVLGDWAYGKLRLKGFYENESKKAKPLNNIINLEKYLKDNCAVNCRYFLLKKTKEKKNWLSK